MCGGVALQQWVHTTRCNTVKRAHCGLPELQISSLSGQKCMVPNACLYRTCTNRPLIYKHLNILYSGQVCQSCYLNLNKNSLDNAGANQITFVRLCTIFGGFNDQINISTVAHCTSLSCHRAAMERSENVTSSLSTSRIYITMPTRGIPEAPELQMPQDSYQAVVVVPMVSSQKGSTVRVYMQCCKKLMASSYMQQASYLALGQ